MNVVNVVWEEFGDNEHMGNTLYASIVVCGVMIHLTAVEVVDGHPPSFEQTSVHPAWVKELEFQQEDAGGVLQTFRHTFYDGVTRTMTILPSTGGA